MTAEAPSLSGPVAFLVEDLGEGAGQRSQMRLAGALAARGLPVDLVVDSGRLTGSGVAPPGVRVVNLRPGPRSIARLMPLFADPPGFVPLAGALLTSLRPSKTLAYLPSLLGYLRRERPAAVVGATRSLNLEAIWAARLARSPARVIVRERGTSPARDGKDAPEGNRRLLPLVNRFYPTAHAIVASSRLIADELAAAAALDRRRVAVIYDALIGPEVTTQAEAACPHPWLAPGNPPVVLGTGRLTEQKDFSTLVRAFAMLRAHREARLLILSRGDPHAKRHRLNRSALEELARSLGIEADLAILESQGNIHACMARAGVFALSSAWESFGNVLVEALACGCPVVSTDCPRGPREILEEGRWGPLVRVGDAVGLGAAIARVLDQPPPGESLAARAAEFSLDRAVDAYLELIASG